jgi:Mce-associated membrane protein
MMASINDALSLAEQAEAEAAEAEAQAAAARVRAEELRAQKLVSDKAASDKADEAVKADAPEVLDDDATVADQPRRWRSPGLRWAAVAVADLLLCALLAASGFMLWQGHQASERRAQQAEFAAAARQGVVNLMSLDFNHGDADIKRLIDSTTGQFRDDFEKSQNDFLSVMKDAKVVTKADVKATAVDNMTKDSADVMVAASSQISNSASATQPARGWRLNVTVQRDNGQLKMSKVEFVP